MQMQQILYGFVFLACMGGFYAFVYTMNHKTPVPEGCEDLKAECEGCKISSCENHPIHDLSKGENK